MAGFVRAVGLVAWRELQAEWRARSILPAMVVFSLVVGVMFSFALNPGRQVLAEILPGLIWLTFFFAGMLGLGRSFARDAGHDPAAGVLAAPAEPSVLFYGRALANGALVGVTSLFSLAAFAALFDAGWPLDRPAFWAALALGLLGFVAAGTLLGAVAAHARAAELLLPVLGFPVLVPVAIAAVQTTAGSLAGLGWEELATGYRILVVFNVVFWTLPYLLFEWLVEG